VVKPPNVDAVEPNCPVCDERFVKATPPDLDWSNFEPTPRVECANGHEFMVDGVTLGLNKPPFLALGLRVDKLLDARP
jgi:hypothetical protein